jgi:hypothetical protein
MAPRPLLIDAVTQAQTSSLLQVIQPRGKNAAGLKGFHSISHNEMQKTKEMPSQMASLLASSGFVVSSVRF